MHCLLSVSCNTSAIFKSVTQVELSLWMPLIRSKAVELNSLPMVLLYTLAFVKHETQIELSARVSLICCTAEPFLCLRIVLLNTQTISRHDAHVELSVLIALRRFNAAEARSLSKVRLAFLRCVGRVFCSSCSTTQKHEQNERDENRRYSSSLPTARGGGRRLRVLWIGFSPPLCSRAAAAVLPCTLKFVALDHLGGVILHATLRGATAMFHANWANDGRKVLENLVRIMRAIGAAAAKPAARCGEKVTGLHSEF